MKTLTKILGTAAILATLVTSASAAQAFYNYLDGYTDCSSLQDFEHRYSYFKKSCDLGEKGINCYYAAQPELMDLIFRYETGFLNSSKEQTDIGFGLTRIGIQHLKRGCDLGDYKSCKRLITAYGATQYFFKYIKTRNGWWWTEEDINNYKERAKNWWTNIDIEYYKKREQELKEAKEKAEAEKNLGNDDISGW